MATLLVAHGTRNPHGNSMIRKLAAAMSAELGETVQVSFVDVLGPAPDELLRMLHHEPAVLVPALLSSGQHVRIDVPKFVASSGHSAVSVTRPLGPSWDLTHAMLDRLVEAGWRVGDQIVLAAAGSRDPQAQRDVALAATMLSILVGARVSIGFAAPCRDGSGFPPVAEVVARLRQGDAPRVAVASYLLAEGLFQSRLRESGADVVGEPLGLHPAVVRLACRRQREPGMASRTHAA